MSTRISRVALCASAILLLSLAVSPVAAIHADQGSVLPVPYWNQYHAQRSDDCGPTSVAMAAGYYGLWPSGMSVGDFTTQIRIDATGSSADGLTSASQLENAAADIGLSYSDMGNIDATSALQTMAEAIGNGMPTVAFIDASQLGRWYEGHWVVVTGFSSDGGTVYLNDPDSNPRSGTDTYPGGQIKIPLTTFYQALQSASAQGYDLGFVVSRASGGSGDPGNGGKPCGITACTGDLGGVDLNGYCQSVGFQGVSLDGTTAYDWHCDDWYGNEFGIDMNAACQWQYPTAMNVGALMADINDPNSWHCYGYPVG